jgi:hypothetical protein
LTLTGSAQLCLPTQALDTTAGVLVSPHAPFLNVSPPPPLHAPEAVPNEANRTVAIASVLLAQPMVATWPSSTMPHSAAGAGGDGGGGGGGGGDGCGCGGDGLGVGTTAVTLVAPREKTLIGLAVAADLGPNGSANGAPATGSAHVVATDEVAGEKPTVDHPDGKIRMSMSSCGIPLVPACNVRDVRDVCDVCDVANECNTSQQK